MFRRAALCALSLAVLATTALAAAEASPQDMLRGLYAQYDVHSHGRQPLHLDPKALMTPQLAHAYTKVRHAEAGDAPPLDWDVFVNAQDYDVQHLSLTVAQGGKSEMVTAAFDNLGQPVTVIYAFAHTPAGWRIDDIRYPPDRIYPKGFSLQAFARRAG
jgi:hypothetical protein